MNRKAAERWAATHWLKDDDTRRRNGMKITQYPDRYFPDVLIGMGKLIEFHVTFDADRARNLVTSTRKATPARLRKARADADVILTFPKGCILAFTMDKAEHLYPCLTPEAKRDVQEMFCRDNSGWTLPAYARTIAKGRQTGFPQHHPDIRVSPIGPLTHVVYETYKEGDDYSQYIHEFGEESGVLPHLAADNDGRLWVAGGNYTTPVEGITD